MNILLLSATDFEIAPLFEWVKAHGEKDRHFFRLGNDLNIAFMTAGIGLTATAYKLTRALATTKFDLVIQAGIAGLFYRQAEHCHPGQVFRITMDYFADLGVQEADSTFRNIFELDFVKPDQPPYNQSFIRETLPAGRENMNSLLCRLPEAVGISVNKAAAIMDIPENMLKASAGMPVTESMEGAACFYVCRMEQVPAVQIRSISNWVAPRDPSKWKIKEAIKNLNNCLISLLEPQMKQMRLKTLEKFDNYFEANVVKEMLISEGIPATLKDENTMTQWGGIAMNLGGISLMVPEDNAALAIALMEDARQEADQKSHSPLSPGDESGEGLNPDNRICPFCGSRNTKSLDYVPAAPKLFRWLVNGLTQSLKNNQWHCFHCGRDFE